ncbi:MULTISPECIES: hypothetical protein [Hymenobacter]|uniref:Uncharacterized protein n=1 Tax=Hymenobacter jejuensis TaxID=2502781 RepID=A0A5B7ZX75_9BACT|nr:MULTISPECIES: hypothetical protein [Hymenobacter]MBC6988430.1 hypothetical protein [Hymenobacter sp. BT491]QDA59215.1 hypothetical protein FHG12_03430 [Hymenobacter jejuensis]
MAFDGTEGSFTHKQHAASLTKKHRTDHPESISSQFFGKEKLLHLLNHPDCVGIRIYNSKSDEGQHGFVVVGVNAEEKDLLHHPEGAERSVALAAPAEATSLILVNGPCCPPSCATENELNA